MLHSNRSLFHDDVRQHTSFHAAAHFQFSSQPSDGWNLRSCDQAALKASANVHGELGYRAAKAAPRLRSDLDAFDQNTAPDRLMVKACSGELLFGMPPEGTAASFNGSSYPSPPPSSHSICSSSSSSSIATAANLSSGVDGSLLNKLLHQAATAEGSSTFYSSYKGAPAAGCQPSSTAGSGASMSAEAAIPGSMQQHKFGTLDQYSPTTASPRDWSLGTEVQRESAAAAANQDLAAPLVNLLAEIPVGQHAIYLDMLLSSSHPQDAQLAMQAAAQLLQMQQQSLDSAAAGQWLQQGSSSSTNKHVTDFLLQPPASPPSQHHQQLPQSFAGAAAAATRMSGSQQLLQQLQLQAALAAQQAVAGTMPAASATAAAAVAQLLQQQTAAANTGSYSQLLQQQMLFLQQQLQQQQQLQHGSTALAMAALGGNAAASGSLPTMPHGLSSLSQMHQEQVLLSSNPAAVAANLWPLAAAGLPASTTLAAAAAAAVAQQQQQNRMSSHLLQAALAGQQHAGMIAAMMPAAACSSNNLSSISMPLAALNHASNLTQLQLQQQLVAGQAGRSGLADAANSSSVNLRGRRSRASTGSSRRASNMTSSSPTFADSFAAAMHGSNRPASLAGSDAGGSDACGAAAAGVLGLDLCPAKFEDFWGTTESEATATAATAEDGSCSEDSWAPGFKHSSSSDGSSSSSSDVGGADSCPSSCRSSRASSAASGWQWDQLEGRLDSDCSIAEQVCDLLAGQCSGAAAGAVTTAAGGCDAVRGISRDQDSTSACTAGAADKGGASIAAAAAAAGSDDGSCVVGGCPVWFPGAGAASSDDSAYLPLPATCRLFVGNIGCWVDEAMLMAYFGKYGKVVDVQVMWNTKMLARGRRVNREFAFISYSTPLEAARAVHWLDGCRLVDLEKDKNGITVEYENGEGEVSTGAVAAAR